MPTLPEIGGLWASAVTWDNHPVSADAQSCGVKPGASIDLGDRADAARAGRRFVRSHVAELAGEDLADDVALVAAELLANATQHGTPPIRIGISGDAHALRLEVADGSSRTPVRMAQNTTNMTGRGLSLVDALAARWGVELLPMGGKVVWAEFSADGVVLPVMDVSVEVIEAAWDTELELPEQRYNVVLGDVPTDLLLEAKAHIDNVVRELSLIGVAGGESDAIPERLIALTETVVLGFSDARDAIKRQALAAAARGERRTQLTLHLPLSAADAGETYLAGLDEVDRYARAARLLTLETPPEHRLFRRWYVESVVSQLRQLAAGIPADPVTPFEQMLVHEIRRLAHAQRISDRAVRLQRVTAALARARTPEDVAAVVVSEGVDALGASGGGLLVPAPDGEHLLVPGTVGYDSDLIGALREERADAPLPAATALRTGEAVWLESQGDRDRQFPALRGFEASTVSMCAVPLVVGDRLIGALRFSFDIQRLFDDDERAFVLALAAQTARTLERTESYEAERTAALGLQRALLPDELPTIEGWEVATYYSPAGGQEVGGDFYDVIPVNAGTTAAVVGDVMGRGVSAAAAMAQIRTTIRAYAIEHTDPVGVFERIDAFFETLDISQLVTALYMLVDDDGEAVVVANAGHVPPLVLTEAGCEPAATHTGTPFGVGRTHRAAARIVVPRGSALIAITDGLIERRGEDIDDGIARVCAALNDAQQLNARQLVTRILSTTDVGNLDDDVTILVLRRL